MTVGAGDLLVKVWVAVLAGDGGVVCAHCGRPRGDICKQQLTPQHRAARMA